ncbi:hypothetical protein F4827_006655 [Paraburkholderia bannensis]|uniref:Uncharacterized protein n=1 Tax=Paraburkholderia bannensis TaxID=765414 RepID=A0A7W9U4E3_9BURK|nr:MULTISPECIES: hypothetical protein [Paraburkholderia]MBB3261721.1 hypothetical protein [Paraburkholderia sp. WP4_3_2]MBB6106779.1 hypothetical protein [Paraburkholderia bannensis]
MVSGNELGQLSTVKHAGHLYIGKDKVDPFSGADIGQGIIGAARLYDGKANSTQSFGQGHADKDVILRDQDMSHAWLRLRLRLRLRMGMGMGMGRHQFPLRKARLINTETAISVPERRCPGASCRSTAGELRAALPGAFG